MDMNHCQFSEDDGSSVEASDWEDPTTDLTKRKVVQYIQFVDDFDGEALAVDFLTLQDNATIGVLVFLSLFSVPSLLTLIFLFQLLPFWDVRSGVL